MCVLYKTNTADVIAPPIEPPVIHEVTPEEILRLYIHSDEIPAGDLARVQELRTVEISGDDILFIPRWFSALYKLEGLTVRACSRMTLLADVFRGMSSLQSFELFSTPIHGMPPSFEEMHQLKKMHIESPATDFTLMDFGGMQSLTELSLVDVSNLLFPSSLANVTTLERMIIVRCYNFTSFPVVIGNLTSLKVLLMESLDISSIPSGTFFPDSIEFLSLSNNVKLENISADVHFPLSLKVLKASNTALASLPISTMQLGRLELVSMNDCPRLKHIPGSLSNCSSMIKMEFWSTQVRGIPEWIWEMPSLEWLNLWGCPIHKRFNVWTSRGRDLFPYKNNNKIY